ncbi:MAG: ERCC4 domain-containing protein [Polyangiaceae bacterium]|jgi:ERCC4-type nuclease
MKPASFIVLVDTREQRIPPFPAGIITEVRTLKEADYSTPALLGIGAIERKSASDFASTITQGRDRFERELHRLRPYRFKCILVEGDLVDVMRATRAHEHSILGSIASFLARYDTPCIFAGNLAGDRSHVGYLIAGLLRRWQERLEEESRGAA